MRRKHHLSVGATGLAILVMLGWAHVALEKAVAAQGQAAAQAPTFAVDPLWPKPLPNHWIVGSVIGLAADSNDHIWILHRPSTLTNAEKGATAKPPTGECCVPAPQILEFDQTGNLLRHFGGPGPGYEWPLSEHGLYVDHRGNVWTGGNNAKDAQVLKFSADGKFLLQIGHQGQSKGSNDTANVGCAADMEVDPATNEVFVADGYCNHRVIVFDGDKGTYKRHWGAYGAKPNDDKQGPYNPSAPPAKQLSTVHCAVVAKDGLVYVCDRTNNRIQVFRKDGTFVKEGWVKRATMGSTVWDIGFSIDAQQRFLFNADAANESVQILRRDSIELLSGFGGGGHFAGGFTGLHNLVADSKGSIYTAETFDGKRVQRFLSK